MAVTPLVPARQRRLVAAQAPGWRKGRDAQTAPGGTELARQLAHVQPRATYTSIGPRPAIRPGPLGRTGLRERRESARG